MDEALSLARQQLRRGELGEAERLYGMILQAHPDHADSLHDLGLVALQRGQLDQAVSLLARAVQLQPRHARFQLNLAIAHQQNGDAARAEAACRRAVELDPQFPPNYYNLGIALQRQESWDEAEAAYRQAITLDEEFVAPCNGLGILLQQQQRLAEAEQCFRRVVALAPQDARGYHNLADVLEEQHRLDEAECMYRRALALDANRAESLFSLSRLLRDQRRLAEAEPLARRAAALNPVIDTRINLALCHRFLPGDPELDELRALLEMDQLPQATRAYLLAALGKAHDDLGDYAAAFEFYRQANAQRGAAWDHDQSRYTAWIDEIKTAFQAAPDNVTAEALDVTPVFVVGASRSGKTLVETILTCSRQVRGLGESSVWTDAIDDVVARSGITDEYPASLPQMMGEQIRQIGENYCARVRSLDTQASLFVHTVPAPYYVGLMFHCFPHARVIYVQRDALDNCLAMYFAQYESGHLYSYDLQSLADYYLGFTDLMSHWRQLYGDRVMQVHYEDLVVTPSKTAERIYAHCGLDFDPALLRNEFTGAEIGRWRHYEPFIGALLEALD